MEKVFIKNNLKSMAIHFSIIMVAVFLYAGAWNSNGKTLSFSIYLSIFCAALYIIGGMLFIEKWKSNFSTYLSVSVVSLISLMLTPFLFLKTTVLDFLTYGYNLPFIISIVFSEIHFNSKITIVMALLYSILIWIGVLIRELWLRIFRNYPLKNDSR